MKRWIADYAAVRPSEATLDVPPSPDIATLEAAAEALSRHREIGHAIAVWAIILRLRMELRVT